MLVNIYDDFDPVKIAGSGQCFRAVCMPDGGVSFITGSHKVTIRQTGATQFSVDCTQEEWDCVWHGYFDLERNYSRIRDSIAAGDVFMRNACEFSRGIRILKQDPWETLVSFIISQRKSIPAIRQAVESLCGHYGTRADGFAAFPSPRELADADLSSCRLGYREPYVWDAVTQAVSGGLQPELLRSCTDEELLGQLMRVHGVGIKVASCTALFAYGRMRIAPVDTWMRKIIDSCYGGIDVFSGHENAGILQQYAFYYALNHKDFYKGAN